VQQVVAEIGSRRPDLLRREKNLKTTEGRPRKYYYSTMSDVAEVSAAENIGSAPLTDVIEVNIEEHALYPLISLFMGRAWCLLKTHRRKTLIK
jgi:hypothetical protein